MSLAEIGREGGDTEGKRADELSVKIDAAF